MGVVSGLLVIRTETQARALLGGCPRAAPGKACLGGVFGFLLPHLPAQLPNPSTPNRSDSDLLQEEMVVVGHLDVKWLSGRGKDAPEDSSDGELRNELEREECCQLSPLTVTQVWQDGGLAQGNRHRESKEEGEEESHLTLRASQTWWVEEMVFEGQHIQVPSLLVTLGSQECPRRNGPRWSGVRDGLEKSTKVVLEE